MTNEKTADEILRQATRERLLQALRERLAAFDKLPTPVTWHEVEDYHLANSRIILEALLYLVQETT